MQPRVVGEPSTLLQIDREKKDRRASFGLVYEVDASPHIRAAEVARAKEAQLKRNKNSQMKHVAKLDWVTIMKIKKDYGLDATNCKGPLESKRLMQILQREYPKLLTTNQKVYRAPRRKIHFEPGTLELAR